MMFVSKIKGQQLYFQNILTDIFQMVLYIIYIQFNILSLSFQNYLNIDN